MPLSTCIIPKFYIMGGGPATIMGVIVWGLRKSCGKRPLDPLRLSAEAISLSVCPNDTHLYIEQTMNLKT